MKVKNLEMIPMQTDTKKDKFTKFIRNFIKRCFDIIIGLFGVIILFPVTLIIFIVKKVIKEEKQPLFYEQLRIGKDGKYFRLYKFRTMIVGADVILKKYLEDNKEAKKEYEINKKLSHDPRITKIGKILRKTSLDEIPQFINVLKGDMSFVGPRPYLVDEKESMGKYYNQIIKVKPGLTGLWQVNGRSNTTFNERLIIEADYVKKFSLILDIKIMIRTFFTVIKRKGAL